MRSRTDRGVALIEFALITPLFMMLVLGGITGTGAYSRANSLAAAAREGARYGATLSKSSGLSTWISKVETAVVSSAGGDLAATAPGRTICVAYVTTDGTVSSYTFTTSDAVGSLQSTLCFDDTAAFGSLPKQRVQVRVQRTSKFEVLLWSTDLLLHANADARNEAS